MTENKTKIRELIRNEFEYLTKSYGFIEDTDFESDNIYYKTRFSKNNWTISIKTTAHGNKISHQLVSPDGDNKKHIDQEIKKQTKRKEGYKKLEKQLKETGEVQISTSDPDSRQMIIRNNITEVAYNAQPTAGSS